MENTATRYNPPSQNITQYHQHHELVGACDTKDNKAATQLVQTLKEKQGDIVNKQLRVFRTCEDKRAGRNTQIRTDIEVIQKVEFKDEDPCYFKLTCRAFDDEVMEQINIEKNKTLASIKKAAEGSQWLTTSNIADIAKDAATAFESAVTSFLRREQVTQKGMETGSKKTDKHWTGKIFQTYERLDLKEKVTETTHEQTKDSFVYQIHIDGVKLGSEKKETWTNDSN